MFTDSHVVFLFLRLSWIIIFLSTGVFQMSCLICTSSRLRSTWSFMGWSCSCRLMNLSPVCSAALLRKSRSSASWSSEAAGSATRCNYKVNRSKRDVHWLISTLKPRCCVHGRPNRRPGCLHDSETFRKNDLSSFGVFVTSSVSESCCWSIRCCPARLVLWRKSTC